MVRKLRLEYPDAIYHPPPPKPGGFGGTSVMSRGDQREDIFLDDVDRHDGQGWNTLRRNFSNTRPEVIEAGIGRLAIVFRDVVP
jgi:hypothetical protein